MKMFFSAMIIVTLSISAVQASYLWSDERMAVQAVIWSPQLNGGDKFITTCVGGDEQDILECDFFPVGEIIVPTQVFGDSGDVTLR